MQVQLKTTCPQCGNLFFCNANDISNCAFAKIKQLQLLKDTFTACVCISCLNKFAEINTN